jgi:hypothetical protein
MGWRVQVRTCKDPAPETAYRPVSIRRTPRFQTLNDAARVLPRGALHARRIDESQLAHVLCRGKALFLRILALCDYRLVTKIHGNTGSSDRQ